MKLELIYLNMRKLNRIRKEKDAKKLMSCYLEEIHSYNSPTF